MKVLRLMVALTALVASAIPSSAQDATDDPDRDNPAVQIPILQNRIDSIVEKITPLEQLLKKVEDRRDTLKLRSSKAYLKKLEADRIQLQAEIDFAGDEFQQDSALIAANCQSGDAEIDEQFRKDSAEIAQLQAELEKLERNSGDVELQTVLAEARSVVNSRYDASRVQEAAKRVKELRNQTTDAATKKELSKLYVQLDDYMATVQVFQDLIREIDEQIKSNKSWADIKKVIDAQEEDGEVVTSIKAIPWLEGIYKAYVEALEKNDGKKSEYARRQIMDIKL